MQSRQLGPSEPPVIYSSRTLAPPSVRMRLPEGLFFFHLFIFTRPAAVAAESAGKHTKETATCERRFTIVLFPSVGRLYRIMFVLYYHAWRNGYSIGLAISRSLVQILLETTLRNNLGQVVHTYVSLSTSSITWYRPKGGDALRLGR